MKRGLKHLLILIAQTIFPSHLIRSLNIILTEVIGPETTRHNLIDGTEL